MQALRIWALALFLGMAPGWPQTNGNNGAPPPIAPAQSPAPPTQSRPNQQPGQVLPDSTKLEPVQTEKDPSGAASMINARAETASIQPAFRDALKGLVSFERRKLPWIVQPFHRDKNVGAPS
jgi:putative SOS response-associated peptidase YedK